MRILKDHIIYDLTEGHIKSYLLWLLQSKKSSESKVHIALHALEFYFGQVLGKPNFFFAIPRPRKPIQLPTVYSGKEVKQIIRSVDNIKHKTILMPGLDLRFFVLGNYQLNVLLSRKT